MRTYKIEQAVVAALALPGAIVSATLGGWTWTALLVAALGIASEVYAQKLAGYAQRKLEQAPKGAELECYRAIVRATWIFWALNAALFLARATSPWQLVAWVPLLIWRREYKAIRACIRSAKRRRTHEERR